MELKEFQGLALRTEVIPTAIPLNTANLISILKVVVEITEILDGVKKAVFYNKNKKLEDELVGRLATIAKLIMALEWQSSGKGPVGAVMDKDATISNLDPRVFHGILGIVTESGELAAALLTVLENPEATIDAVNIQEEMSDIAWYKAILHDSLNLDWDQGLTNVINKLKIRYPEKYSDECAAERDLSAERAALEVGFIDAMRDPRPMVVEGYKAYIRSDDNALVQSAGSVDDPEPDNHPLVDVDEAVRDFLSGKYDPESTE
jgi:NTP pyrophosphatase (non-canonical NTP hydrolase)